MTSTTTKLSSIFGAFKPSKALDPPNGSLLEADILALRTMLKMLSLLQHLKTDEDSNTRQSVENTEVQKREIKVLSALATVLVMEHEKVAVVAKHGNGEGIEVFACTDQIAADKTNDSYLTDLWNFLTTINPKTKGVGLSNKGAYPCIRSLKDEAGYPEGASLEELQTMVRSHW
jgi:hypothetical protein